MQLLMACNDDNGNHQGFAEQIQFEMDDNFDPVLELEGVISCEIVFRVSRGVTTGRLRLSHRWFPIEGYGTWVGNMCWDAARITTETAAAIANYLLALKKLDCVAGQVELYEAWNAGQPIYFEKESE